MSGTRQMGAEGVSIYMNHPVSNIFLTTISLLFPRSSFEVISRLAGIYGVKFINEKQR